MVHVFFGVFFSFSLLVLFLFFIFPSCPLFILFFVPSCPLLIARPFVCYVPNKDLGHRSFHFTSHGIFFL
jgi:hypothetical protein